MLFPSKPSILGTIFMEPPIWLCLNKWALFSNSYVNGENYDYPMDLGAHYFQTNPYLPIKMVRFSGDLMGLARVSWEYSRISPQLYRSFSFDNGCDTFMVYDSSIAMMNHRPVSEWVHFSCDFVIFCWWGR